MNIEEQISTLLSKIVPNKVIHAKWLNALSYMENSGAKKIAAHEHRTEVSEEVLKHASEEFGHAHFLKKQIARLDLPVPKTYQKSSILGGHTTLRYLDKLDLSIARLIKKEVPQLTLRKLRDMAYLLVTYAIEVRAKQLYPIYHSILKTSKERISMRLIIAEEEGHLEEMEKAIQNDPFAPKLTKKCLDLEESYFNKWLKKVELEVA
jgi:hypothetical protein